MAEIIEKLKKSDFEWKAVGRFAIDNILNKYLEHIDYFSIMISEADKKKCNDFVIKYNLFDVNVVVSEHLENKYLTINGIKTIYNEQTLEETAPRYYNNNKIQLKKKINEYKKTLP